MGLDKTVNGLCLDVYKMGVNMGISTFHNLIRDTLTEGLKQGGPPHIHIEEHLLPFMEQVVSYMDTVTHEKIESAYQQHKNTEG